MVIKMVDVIKLKCTFTSSIKRIAARASSSQQLMTPALHAKLIPCFQDHGDHSDSPISSSLLEKKNIFTVVGYFFSQTDMIIRAK